MEPPKKDWPQGGQIPESGKQPSDVDPDKSLVLNDMLTKENLPESMLAKPNANTGSAILSSGDDDCNNKSNVEASQMKIENVEAQVGLDDIGHKEVSHLKEKNFDVMTMLHRNKLNIKAFPDVTQSEKAFTHMTMPSEDAAPVITTASEEYLPSELKPPSEKDVTQVTMSSEDAAPVITTASEECVPTELKPSEKDVLTSSIDELKLKSPVVLSVSNSDCMDKVGYQLKDIPWLDHCAPIVTQNENGPCPLIAIANVLLLRGKIDVLPDMNVVTAEQLMDHVADCIMENIPTNLSEMIQLNYEQNVNDAIGVLPRTLTGLDVNIRFTGVRDFEYTPECIIFDLLNIPLYHGWVIDPQATDVVAAIGSTGYNQLVESLIVNKCSHDSELVTKALTAEMFLNNTATQLTYHGLCELNSTMESDEIAVLFRNNHFSTIYKRGDELFQLVTDQGFLKELDVVWEVLCNIEGDSLFVDGYFIDCALDEEPYAGNFTFLDQSVSTEQQIDQDLELARRLHLNYQRDLRTMSPGSPSSSQLRSSDRNKKGSGCTIL